MENKGGLKVVSSSVVFQEVPDEISLALEISNCPCHCEGCSSKFLWDDIGEVLDDDMLKSLIEKHDDVTNVLFMGGDADHAGIAHLADVAHSLGKKAAVFSGLDSLDAMLMAHVDYYKIGRFIMPKGDPDGWHKSNNGPICFPWSNQLMFAKRDADGHEMWENITHRFREAPLGNPARHIISSEGKRMINEDNKVKKALFGDARGKVRTFAIMSAENPMGEPLSDKENRARDAVLRGEMRAAKVQYKRILGRFGGNDEHSYMMFNLSLDDAKNFAKQFKQLSFFFGEVGRIEYGASDDRSSASKITYYKADLDDDEVVGYSPVAFAEGVSSADEFNDFFSKAKGYKFSIDMPDGTFESLAEIFDPEALERSFDDSNTARYRWHNRICAYANRKR